jgi:hypothetical protein
MRSHGKRADYEDHDQQLNEREACLAANVRVNIVSSGIVDLVGKSLSPAPV